jgi:hypothetical protein
VSEVSPWLGTSQEPCRLRHGEDIALESGRPAPTLKS